MVNRELKEKKNTFSFKCKYIIHRDILLGAQTQYTSDTCGMSSIVLYLWCIVQVRNVLQDVGLDKLSISSFQSLFSFLFGVLQIETSKTSLAGKDVVD